MTEEPKYTCTTVKSDYLELHRSEKDTLVFDMPQSDAYLSKDDVKDLILELQSWVDTGDWVKPKKMYACIGKDMVIHLADEHGFVKFFNDKNFDVYELNEENRVKFDG